MPGLRIPRKIGLLCASLCLILSPLLRAEAQAHITHMDVTHGKPFVMVQVNGHGPFRFIVDTGTGGQAFISPTLVSQLGLAQIGRMHITDPSHRGSRTTPLVLIPSLELAGIEFTNIHAAVHELDDGEGICQGLLGFEFFRSFLLTLDYPHHQLELASGALAPDGEQSVLPFRMPDGIPLVTIRIDSSTTGIDAQLDSGGAGLSLPESFAAHIPFSSDPVSFSNSFSVATRFQIKAGRLAGAVHLGAYTFEQPFVEIHPAFPVANFGSIPMQNFTITFDQHNNLVRFDSARQTIHLSATPAPMRLDNGPPVHPPDPALIPVG